MFLDQKVPDECKLLWQKCQELVPKFMENAPVSQDSVTIASETKLDTQRNLYLIKEGILNEYYQDRLVMSYQEGDLVAADNLFVEKGSEYNTDFAVIVNVYKKDDIIDYIFANTERCKSWCQYLTCLSQCFHILMAHFNKQEASFNPEIREYDAGDIIINEGASDTEVFTLLSGSAQVISDETIVGKIETDEIFGAIAALTGTKRTASIVAETDCTALVVQSHHFKNLIAVRPDTVTKLIEDLARTVISCNRKIVDLSNIKS